MEEILYYIGQLFGGFAVVLGFLNYQVKTREKLLFIHLSTTICFSVHYMLIGAYAGMAMNLVGAVRNTVFFFVGKNGKVSRGYSIGFAILMAVMGIISWEAWYSVLAVIALTVNSYAMSFSDPNNIRKSILITSPMVLVYDALARSYGGTVYETVAIISAVIGIVRYKRANDQRNTFKES